jgi:hypothetical protein
VPSEEVLTEEGKAGVLVRRSSAGGIKYCPQCLKPLTQLSSISGWLTPDYYECSECGYSGPVALEMVKEEKRGNEKGEG